MAHEVETMAYVGEVPWHGLGRNLGSEHVDAKTMRKAAGLEWDVAKVPLYDAQGREVGVWGIERTDTGECFRGVSVGKTYQPLSNEALCDFAADLREAAGSELQWETAGSLRSGRRVWMLARMLASITVHRRGGASDVAVPYLLLANAHDGSTGIDVRGVATRVVCKNTLGWALRENSDARTIRHTKSAEERMREACATMGLAFASMERQAETFQSLADTPLDTRGFATLIAQLLTERSDPEDALETLAKAEGVRKANLERDGAALMHNWQSRSGAADNAAGADRYDALQAVTRFIDHQRGRLNVAKRTAKRALAATESSMFGTGDDMKRRALRLLAK